MRVWQYRQYDNVDLALILVVGCIYRIYRVVAVNDLKVRLGEIIQPFRNDTNRIDCIARILCIAILWCVLNRVI